MHKAEEEGNPERESVLQARKEWNPGDKTWKKTGSPSREVIGFSAKGFRFTPAGRRESKEDVEQEMDIVKAARPGS